MDEQRPQHTPRKTLYVGGNNRPARQVEMIITPTVILTADGVIHISERTPPPPKR